MKQIFEETSEWFKEKFDLVNQNRIMRTSKKQLEKKYTKVIDEINELNSKYISLLEEKSEKFDLYLYYKSQCEELVKERRELKRQNALLTETVNSQEQEILKLSKKTKSKNNRK